MSAAFKYKTGIVCGAFDVIHPGYIRMFEDAKSICENLVVLLQTDPTIDRPEKNKPTQTIIERYVQLRGCKYIDEIIPYITEQDLLDVLNEKIKE